MTSTQIQQFETTLSGAQIFLECLRKENVTDIFGYPGGVILDIYEALFLQRNIYKLLPPMPQQ